MGKCELAQAGRVHCPDQPGQRRGEPLAQGETPRTHPHAPGTTIAGQMGGIYGSASKPKPATDVQPKQGQIPSHLRHRWSVDFTRTAVPGASLINATPAPVPSTLPTFTGAAVAICRRQAWAVKHPDPEYLGLHQGHGQMALPTKRVLLRLKTTEQS
ncbi:hypothetical protein DPEC_G00027500 [Dallia pectoralis]|uniref:Uncharacterized protein n=1 Tax=Dallia pectoralis TaxID=75939 RepID=A0ACC2HI55_DALPE|nr:hypothetical protein DPEC_G00027500 [Dallia pectoralis]